MGFYEILYLVASRCNVVPNMHTLIGGVVIPFVFRTLSDKHILASFGCGVFICKTTFILRSSTNSIHVYAYISLTERY